ncbi:acyltransferase family protein [Duganella sp. FT50W]|uniref:Acyltransferase family protein n=1 Tax=Duganella lactea TaxID=2692173 RepID=A0A6L8MSS9_9BURK|nr:acyltransferase [Duganella lactea]MYM85049.1 acyltransferase family protein [Duganella lactea]
MTKFIFANQLRGIAALLVVMTHYFGTFFAEQALLSERTFSPNLHLVKGGWVHFFELEYQGPFGVALFFLISGFVIPFSLKKSSVGGFLVNRILRIFPTYATCLAIGTLAIALSAHYWGQAFSYNGGVLAANALLVHNLLNLPSMDAVNWTLSIEVKFYILAALGAAALFRPHPGWLLGFLAGAVGITTWWWHGGASMPPTILTMELNYLIFMLAGCLFYQHVAGLIRTRALLLRSVLVLASFSLTWSIGPQHDQFPSVTRWYYSAWVVFAACYALRAHFRPLPVLDWLAAISYPLYCVHALFGYCALKILIDQGCRYGVAVLITLPCTFALAYLVHITVENGSNQLGRRWGDALSRRPPAATTG